MPRSMTSKEEAIMQSNNSQRVRTPGCTGPLMVHSHPPAGTMTAKTITVPDPAPPTLPRSVQLGARPEAFPALPKAVTSSTEYFTSAPPRTLHVVAASTGNRVRENMKARDAGH
jgi:hypothetical protein